MPVIHDCPEIPISPRGPLSTAVLHQLTSIDSASTESVSLAQYALDRADSILEDDDVQCALFLLYASAYGSLPQLLPDLEWASALIETRRALETAWERELREHVAVPPLPEPQASEIARTLFEMATEDSGPSLARFLARHATAEQAREFMMHRSIYTLREADPHSWAIPRLTGAPKAALVEIQSDEYGGGRAERMHATLFASSMRAAGLDDTYGAYLDHVPAITLASQNMMSMFGLNRRLLGAIVGHLSAFEMTSSIPNRFYGDGFRRLGYGADMTEYFDEHVEADAVHEQIAAHDLAGGLVEQQPDLLTDVLFGAAACLAVDGDVSARMLACWSADTSSLRPTPAP